LKYVFEGYFQCRAGMPVFDWNQNERIRNRLSEPAHGRTRLKRLQPFQGIEIYHVRPNGSNEQHFTGQFVKPPCPLQVLKATPYGPRWADNGGPKQLRIESTNVGDKEINAAVFRIIYKDMLGRETGRGLSEPVMVHEPGHKTMRPGKKGGNYYEWSISSSA
jgi:hypothetical protein